MPPTEAAVEWAAGAGPHAKAATFFDAAADGEVIINATPGAVSLEVLAAASTRNLDGKVLIDVANPLDHSAGFPPSLAISNTDSLAETIQRSFPTARVVTALNTMRADVMVAPDRLAGGDHDVFMAGDDAGAKEVVAGLLREFGWRPEHIRDLGPLEAARGDGDVASAVAPHLPSAGRPRVQHQGGLRISCAQSPERRQACPSATGGGWAGLFYRSCG
ncbi:NAD(P)-binding domain-containing protein [Arthrobacter sp. Soil736]|uniref:NADPH-dependent F420 reductase n=1 Tax=Arthrobacter sp. Soil736 TaxID=1736395 RepID=UPI003211D3DE